jgi:hypothetical protein
VEDILNNTVDHKNINDLNSKEGQPTSFVVIRLEFNHYFINNLTIKTMTHSEQATADARKAQIQIEINSQKIDIDKSVFVKTEEDRKALKKAKLLVGTVSGLRDDCIRAIISSSPNFGSLSFKTF